MYCLFNGEYGEHDLNIPSLEANLDTMEKNYAKWPGTVVGDKAEKEYTITSTIKKQQKVHTALSWPRVLTYRPLFIPIKKFRKPQKCIPKNFAESKRGFLFCGVGLVW